MKVKSFIKETIARLTQDDKTVIGEQNYRRVDSGLSGQIATLQGKKIDAENLVADAQEALAKAKYPDYRITDITSYFRSVKQAQEALTSAEQSLEDVVESINYYTTWQKENNKEVDVEAQA